jgi:hypothetical protein
MISATLVNLEHAASQQTVASKESCAYNAKIIDLQQLTNDKINHTH